MRIWLFLAGLAAAALLTAPSAARPDRAGGTLRVAYGFQTTTMWHQIDYATCLRLFNFPDTDGRSSTRIIPEASAGFPRISQSGRRYDFDVQAGFTRFSNGEPVTARSFAFGLKYSSVGEDLSRVRVRGSHLIVDLKEPAPPDFLRRLTTVCAVSKEDEWPPYRDLPRGAGPYYLATRISLKRNRYYHGSRPHHLDEILFEDLGEDNEAFGSLVDETSDWFSLESPLGDRAVDVDFAATPRGRVNQTTAVSQLAFNADTGRIFANRNLRKAVALAIDRAEIARETPPKIGTPFDHFIPPTVPGSRQARVYPGTPSEADLARARELAAPFVPVRVLMNAKPGIRRRSEAIARQLARIGIDVRIGYCWALDCPADLFLRTGVPSENADPGAILRNALYRFHEQEWLDRLDRANRLRPPRARLAALGKLDLDLARTAVPAVALSIVNSRELFSRRVGCLQFHRVYHVDLAALCIKR